MIERHELLASIVETTADYRQGILPPPTSEHVDCWVKQFDDSFQLPILQEMDHVLKKTYFSRKKVKKILEQLFKENSLVGNGPCAFWKSIKFLNIQERGASQKEMLTLFNKILEKKCGFQVNDCGKTSRTFFYLDDGIFTGNRIKNDFKSWIAGEAPEEAEVYVIIIALHIHGFCYAWRDIQKAIKLSGKKIKFFYKFLKKLEDRGKYATASNVSPPTSDVLWPTTIPDNKEIKEYVNSLNHSVLFRSARQASSLNIFSSDTRRQILEQEFLKAGIQIRRECLGLTPYQRPLGNSVLETLGFGSLIVTFRNCPNNAPLALWADRSWHPLFDRATNTETSQQEEDF
ncbi:MAG: hypothetical protein OXF29_00980 [Hyphomicrobiales bacterium]|nr:hypothetical protein [Hyphomicrobiales bacterium]